MPQEARGLERRAAFATVYRRLFRHADEPSVRLGRFVLIERIGEGGMGVVYLAFDPRLGRKVALKLVRPRCSSVQSHAMFEREARSAAALAHPNVVTLHESGVADDGRFFLVMEFVDGQTLRRWLQQTPRRWPEIVQMFVGAGRGLAAAHAQGLVHHDFKPDNVLIGGDERPRVADFGLARSIDEPMPGPSHADDSESSATAPGGGTPGYMAPEQREGVHVGPAADQYALCVSLHEALMGWRPEPGDRGPPVRGAPGGPRRLLRVIRRGQAPEPSRRFPSMLALVDRLESLVRAHRRRRWLVLGGAVAVVTGVTGHALADTESIDPCDQADAALRASWDSDRRATLANSLDAIPGPTGAWALSRLDRFAEHWATMRRDSCDATYVRGEQSDQLLDQRVACLDRRLHAFDRLVGHLTEASPNVLERTVELVQGLESVDVCAAEIVREQHEVARAAGDQSGFDPEARLAWQGLSRRLEDARLVGQLGDHAQAIELLQAIEAGAAAHGLTRLRAESMVLRANDELDRTPTVVPAVDLEQAVGLAAGAADVHTAIEAIAELLRLERLQPDRPSHRSMLIALGRGLAPRSAQPAHELAVLALYEGSIDLQQAALQSAIDRFGEGLEHLRDAGISDDDATALDLRSNLCVAMFQAGHYAKAEPQLRALWLAQRAVLPEAHVKLGYTALHRGHVARRLDRLDEAAEHYRTASSILTERRGPTHPETAKATLGLANVELARGEFDAAAALYERLIALGEQTHGAEHPGLVLPLERLAETERLRGWWEPAEAHVARAVALAERGWGAEHPHTAAMRISWGKILLGGKRPSEAVVQLERALAALRDAQTEPAWRGEARLYLAQALHANAGSSDRVAQLCRDARRDLGASSDVLVAELLAELDRFERERNSILP